MQGFATNTFLVLVCNIKGRVALTVHKFEHPGAVQYELYEWNYVSYIYNVINNLKLTIHLFIESEQT